MVEVTNSLQPMPQRQLRLVPFDLVKKIGTAASGLRRKSTPDQMCNNLLGGEVEDRAVFVLDLLVALIDDVEDRMRVQVGGNYILPVPDLKNLGPMIGLDNHFDRGILQGIYHARDPGSGFALVRDQVNVVSDFHAFSCCRYSGKGPGMFDDSMGQFHRSFLPR